MRRMVIAAVLVAGTGLVGTIAANAQTAAPAAAPADKQHVISDQDLALMRQDLRSYADRYGTLSDDEAQSLIKNWLDVDIAATQLRAKYLTIVSKAIGGRKGATFAQIDRRLAAIVDLQLGSRIPLVQSQ